MTVSLCIKEKWWFSQCGRTWQVCRKRNDDSVSVEELDWSAEREMMIQSVWKNLTGLQKEKWWFSQCGRTWLVCRKRNDDSVSVEELDWSAEREMMIQSVWKNLTGLQKEKWWFSQCGRTWLVCRKQLNTSGVTLNEPKTHHQNICFIIYGAVNKIQIIKIPVIFFVWIMIQMQGFPLILNRKSTDKAVSCLYEEIYFIWFWACFKVSI